jgi:cytidylate kinase
MQIETQIPVITLDGPSGTGKGTICHRLADHLGWHFLDSGVLYRVLAYAAIAQQVDLDAVDELVQLAHELKLRFVLNQAKQNCVFLADEDISQDIRAESCGQSASKIASLPVVREALLARQRAFAQLPGLVTDGRDMGTVVFPNACLKIYLYADAKERAMRRYLQLQATGINASLAQVVEELEQRDARDMARSFAPLKPADDAFQIDTTGLTIDQVFHHVLELYLASKR